MITEATELSKQHKKIVIVNGSPRATGNTATLLHHVEAGARELGSGSEWVDLYKIVFQGCRSCFACKLKGGPSYGRCSQRDGLSSVLAEIAKADAIVLGSPIYLGAATGAMRSFLERLIFPWFTYTEPPQSIAPKMLATGVVYTFGATEEVATQPSYALHFGVTERLLGLVFGAPVQTLMSYDTLQFSDYSKYVADRFDPVHKEKRHQEVFPKDCEKAQDLGRSLVK
jgi:multimeric flavodoxin WrbA